ncbi:extended synaptotagmin-2-like [Montipora capricornis]|uniref:extended synaptotagmin-2-like n=1 Tax=Montipora capricornis TaxID=246305 RepID=UPI0035F157A5
MDQLVSRVTEEVTKRLQPLLSNLGSLAQQAQSPPSTSLQAPAVSLPVEQSTFLQSSGPNIPQAQGHAAIQDTVEVPAVHDGVQPCLPQDDDTSDEEEGDTDEPDMIAEDELHGESVGEIPRSKESEGNTVRRRKTAPKIQRTVSGDIRLTTRYNKQGSKLEVMVHEARKLLACDSDGLSDPYVRAYLLPDKSRSGRRRTDVKKNTLEPVFDETFDWFVPEDQLKERTLDITVKNNVSFFSKSKTSMGQVLLDLSKIDLSNPITEWYMLRDEQKEED